VQLCGSKLGGHWRIEAVEGGELGPVPRCQHVGGGPSAPGRPGAQRGSGRYFGDNSATPTTGGAVASAGRRPELLAMEGGVGRDHLGVDASADAGVDLKWDSGSSRWPV
jgi:hypothetical protein